MPKLDLLKGTLPLLVLSVLREEELYGYEIAQRIRDRSGDLFAPSEGSLYPTLHRLERDGALSATWLVTTTEPGISMWELFLTGAGADGRRYVIASGGGGNSTFTGAVWDWVMAISA